MSGFEILWVGLCPERDQASAIPSVRCTTTCGTLMAQRAGWPVLTPVA